MFLLSDDSKSEDQGTEFSHVDEWGEQQMIGKSQSVIATLNLVRANI